MAPARVSKIKPSLFLGGVEAVHLGALQRHKITSVVTLLDLDKARLDAKFRSLIPSERHLFINCKDTATENLLAQLPQICDFIDEQLAKGPVPRVVLRFPRVELAVNRSVNEEEEEADLESNYTVSETGAVDGSYSSEYRPNLQPVVLDYTIEPRVLVHCHMGISRSAAAVVAYLMRKHSITHREAINQVLGVRECIFPNAGFMEQLKVWEETRSQLYEKDSDIPKKAYRLYLETRAQILEQKGVTDDKPASIVVPPPPFAPASGSNGEPASTAVPASIVVPPPPFAPASGSNGEPASTAVPASIVVPPPPFAPASGSNGEPASTAVPTPAYVPASGYMPVSHFSDDSSDEE
ncbi:protein-tyrosine phosphatase-like protein [Lasiosphaeria ovina]|uniref:protein-tyrosine-phosphatase n=1 Tax=Lasiosphaeria ovina TaxID=92902 RepID=A0AAE0KGK1_9PEZI|nr:protein-tyrosine phosphatase-like protein [Lasiosphaeria ovina]